MKGLRIRSETRGRQTMSANTWILPWISGWSEPKEDCHRKAEQDQGPKIKVQQGQGKIKQEKHTVVVPYQQKDLSKLERSWVGYPRNSSVREFPESWIVSRGIPKVTIDKGGKSIKNHWHGNQHFERNEAVVIKKPRNAVQKEWAHGFRSSAPEGSWKWHC